jgi:hypothetical protein
LPVPVQTVKWTDIGLLMSQYNAVDQRVFIKFRKNFE